MSSRRPPPEDTRLIFEAVVLDSDLPEFLTEIAYPLLDRAATSKTS